MMGPRPAKSWMLTAGAGLLVLSAALYLERCARLERPGTAASSRARSAGVAEPAENTAVLDPLPRPEALNPAAGASAHEEDRLASQALNAEYNRRLEGLVKNTYQPGDLNHHWIYTASIYDFSPIPASYVSDIDCFHPSARGQREVSKVTWEEGPFKK